MGRPARRGVLLSRRLPPGSLSCLLPGRAQRYQPSFLRRPGRWRVRPPSLTGLLCGCGDAGDGGAAEETEGLGRRRHVSPGPPGLGPRREITVFIEAGAGPLGAGHCGRATVFAGSGADPFPERGAPRLNYVFIQGCVVLPGVLRELGVGCIRAPREPGLAAGRGGLRHQGGRPTCFRGGEVAAHSLPCFSGVARATGVCTVVCGGRVGGVSCFDSCSYFIKTAVREAGRLYGGEGEGARESLRESYRICAGQRRL